jgi:bacteriocin-like protein
MKKMSKTELKKVVGGNGGRGGCNCWLPTK